MYISTSICIYICFPIIQWKHCASAGVYYHVVGFIISIMPQRQQVALLGKQTPMPCFGLRQETLRIIFIWFSTIFTFVFRVRPDNAGYSLTANMWITATGWSLKHNWTPLKKCFHSCSHQWFKHFNCGFFKSRQCEIFSLPLFLGLSESPLYFNTLCF